MAALRPLSFRALLLALALAPCAAAPLRAQDPLASESAQGVNVNLVETELRAAVAVLSQYLDRPVSYGQLGNQRVTFTSPRPVPRSEIAGILRVLLADNGYLMEEAGGAYVIRPRAPAAPSVQEPQPFPPPGLGAQGASLASAGGTELFVIRLRHARASDVAATVNALYGRASALGELGMRRGGTLNDQLNQNRVAEYGQQPAQAAAGPSRTGELVGNLTIVPDFRTNSLLIRSTRPDFELIRAAVEQVDVRPLQVLIETTVAYVRREYGFELGLDVTSPDVALEGTNTTVRGQARSGATRQNLVLQALNLGGIDLDVILRAGESRSNVVILDRPLLLAANNEEAEIVVGEQRPFVQVQRSTDGGVLDEVVQYKDVGTSLRVLPTISADGYVQMQVVQEVNSAAGSAEGLDAPIISTRSVSTQLLVRDGHTAVLGGLTGTQRDRASGGIPFLSSLPVVGALFGRKGRGFSDFELFVFITPHVITSDDEMEDATDDVHRNGGRAGRAARRQRPLIRAEEEAADEEAVDPNAPAPATLPPATPPR